MKIVLIFVLTTNAINGIIKIINKDGVLNMNQKLERAYKPKYIEKCTILSNKIKSNKTLYNKMKKENIYKLIDVYDIARKDLNGFTDETSNTVVQLRAETFVDVVNELTSTKYWECYANNDADCFVSFENGIINPAPYNEIKRFGFV